MNVIQTILMVMALLSGLHLFFFGLKYHAYLSRYGRARVETSAYIEIAISVFFVVLFLVSLSLGWW